MRQTDGGARHRQLLSAWPSQHSSVLKCLTVSACDSLSVRKAHLCPDNTETVSGVTAVFILCHNQDLQITRVLNSVFCSKIKQTLPDVVAHVSDSQHQHSHSSHSQPSHHKHRLKEEFEELEAENERLKAIFDLHSISYNEQPSSKSRRNSDPEPGGKNSVSEVFSGDNIQQTKRSSMSSESSEGRGSTKCEDVRAKVRPDIKNESFGSKSVDSINKRVFEIKSLMNVVSVSRDGLSCFN